MANLMLVLDAQNRVVDFNRAAQATSGVCVNARGLEKGKDYIEDVRVGGLPDFAEIVGDVDRLITL